MNQMDKGVYLWMFAVGQRDGGRVCSENGSQEGGGMSMSLISFTAHSPSS